MFMHIQTKMKQKLNMDLYAGKTKMSSIALVVVQTIMGLGAPTKVTKLIEQPDMIGLYNTYMGGVDVTNICQMHCNSMHMVQNCWWLQVFFYLLDVLISNTMILHKESMVLGNNEIDVADFKEKLVMHMVGKRIVDVPNAVPVIHEVPPNTV
jgi:hypothetical protein